MVWTDPRVHRALSPLCRALCGKSPDSRVWYLAEREGRPLAATGSLGSPDEVDEIRPEYLAVARLLRDFERENAEAGPALREIARVVDSLSDSDDGKARLQAAMKEALERLGA